MKSVFLVAACLPLLAPPESESARAILEKRCAACHGSAQTSGLDIRQRETLFKGGKRRPAVVSGRAEDSLLYKAVAHIGDVQMPPGKQIAAEEVEAIRVW